MAAHPNQPEGQEHDDQGTSWRDSVRYLTDRINAIRALHVKDVTNGMTDGGCKECGLGWPCPTFHLASGWGEMHACLDAGFCARVVVRADEMGYVDE